jgi:hypothetical protein
MTGRFVAFPEVLRNALFVVGTLALALLDGSFTPMLAVIVVLEAAACCLYGLTIVKLCRALAFEDRHLPRVETCPPFFVPAREAIITRLEAFVRWLLDEPVLDFHAVAGLAAGSMLLCHMNGDDSLFSVSATINSMFLALTLTSISSKLLGGTTQSLLLMSRRLGLGTEQRALFNLRSQLSLLPSEGAILRAASVALQELLPGATATAVATFRPEEEERMLSSERHSYSSAGGRLAGLEAAAVNDAARAALEAALMTGNARGTSAAFACRHAASRGSHVVWSADFPTGLAAFSDWRAATRAGLTGQAVTAPLAAGLATIGFITARAAPIRCPASLKGSLLFRR